MIFSYFPSKTDCDFSFAVGGAELTQREIFIEFFSRMMSVEYRNEAVHFFGRLSHMMAGYNSVYHRNRIAMETYNGETLMPLSNSCILNLFRTTDPRLLSLGRLVKASFVSTSNRGDPEFSLFALSNRRDIKSGVLP